MIRPVIQVILMIALALTLCACGPENTTAPTALTPIQQLGKKLFFDEKLSSNGEMSCATCHDPEVGFTGPDSDVNAGKVIYEGAEKGRFGNRKPSSASYTGYCPVLYYDNGKGSWVGGMFWDGRATGWTMNDPLAEQAQGPFLNPLEQNLTDAQEVCRIVAASDYAALFRDVWGKNSLDLAGDTRLMYDRIARAIAAYEHSFEVDPFNSKYDYYLKGQAKFTEQELWGLELFKGKAGCADCHPVEAASAGKQPVFTDFTYHNLGIPKNPQNPFYTMPSEFNPDGKDWVDPGLGGFLKSESYAREVYEPEMGKHKTPSLRNVDLRPGPEFVKAYMHNGFFKSLDDVVHFCNARNVGQFPEAEYSATVDKEGLGNLGLTSDEETAIVAFLKTLSNGYAP